MTIRDVFLSLNPGVTVLLQELPEYVWKFKGQASTTASSSKENTRCVLGLQWK